MNILNIKNQDIKQIIEDSIKETQELLKGLDYNQTCLIYSSLLFEVLRRKNILVHIINTKDLGYYEHQFLLVYDGINYYLIDLTYKQFNNKYLNNLLANNYTLIDDFNFNKYLQIITNSNLSINLSDIFVYRGNNGIKKI